MYLFRFPENNKMPSDHKNKRTKHFLPIRNYLATHSGDSIQSSDTNNKFIKNYIRNIKDIVRI